MNNFLKYLHHCCLASPDFSTTPKVVTARPQLLNEHTMHGRSKHDVYGVLYVALNEQDNL